MSEDAEQDRSDCKMHAPCCLSGTLPAQVVVLQQSWSLFSTSALAGKSAGPVTLTHQNPETVSTVSQALFSAIPVLLTLTAALREVLSFTDVDLDVRDR